jgi:hypothetical protein
VEDDLFITSSWSWPSLSTGVVVISDDDEAEEDPDELVSATCTTDDFSFSSGKCTVQAGKGASLPSIKDGGGGGGGRASMSTPRSSDCILEELRRNLEDVAGLTSLFSEDLGPLSLAAAWPVLLFFFFFLLPCPCCRLEFGEEAEASLALSMSKLGLGGLVEAEVEVRWGSRRRGKWRSMNRLLPLPGPVLATTEVASAEEQEMLMVGRPSLLCTPLRSIDAMDGCRSLWELWVWLVARCWR